jgi:hypothetical protein
MGSRRCGENGLLDGVDRLLIELSITARAHKLKRAEPSRQRNREANLGDTLRTDPVWLRPRKGLRDPFGVRANAARACRRRRSRLLFSRRFATGCCVPRNRMLLLF